MRPLHLVLAICLGWTLACGFFEQADAPHFTDAVPLTPPWSGLGLPVETARVTFSDAETCTVHADTTVPVPELGRRYGAALAGAGWTMSRDDSTPVTVNQTWTQGDQILSLAVLESAGEHVVSLALVPF